MTCACSSAGPCVVHDGTWARLRSQSGGPPALYVSRAGAEVMPVGVAVERLVRELSRNDFVSYNPARHIMSVPPTHSELWDRIEPLLPELRLHVERSRLLGLLSARAG